MKKKTINTYVIILSKEFLKGHSKEGQSTNFKEKFEIGQGCKECKESQNLSGENISQCNSCSRAIFHEKIHTIRGNYNLWEKRINEVQAGKAVLSIRQWMDKPYKSKQEVLAILTKDDGVSIQKLTIKNDGWLIGWKHCFLRKPIATNDGLSIEDFNEWFKGYDDKPLAIIHFTYFRY